MVDGHEVNPTKSERILGVIFDSELRFKNHMAKVKTRGWKSAQQLRRFHHIGPRASRQLFTATVASRTDYAAVVWYAQHLGSKQTNVTGRVLFPIQRLGAQAVVKCFKTVSMDAACAEAFLNTPHTRLKLKIAKFWVDLHALPDSNPLKQHVRRLRTEEQDRKSQFRSPLQHMFNHLQGPNVDMEIIPAWVVPPWRIASKGQCEVERDPVKAVEKYKTDLGTHIQIFTDGSVKEGRAGIGLTASIGTARIKSHHQLVGVDTNINIDMVELGAIFEAARWAAGMFKTIPETAPATMGAVIYSDSLRAIQMIRAPTLSDGASIAADICEVIQKTSTDQRRVSIQWIPKKAQIPEHVEADRLAKVATASIGVTISTMWARRTSRKHSRTKLKALIQDTTRAMSEWKTGQSLRAIDSAIPGKHTKDLYDTLHRKEAQILSQLRTGHTRLNSFLHKIGVVDSAACECGHEKEDIRHFLLHCPRYSTQRQQLADKLGRNYGNTSHMLGGRTSYAMTNGQNSDGPVKSWKPNIDVVRAVVRFALDTGRLNYNAREAEPEAEPAPEPAPPRESEREGERQEAGQGG